MLNWLGNVYEDVAQLGVGLCRMDNLEYIKNQFLTSCYELVVRMGTNLVSNWKGYGRSYVSW